MFKMTSEIYETAVGPMEAAITGDGPAVMILHGVSATWNQSIALADKLKHKYKVILPSRPGYGRTPLSTGKTIDQMANSYAELLKVLKIDKVNIMGISGAGPSTLAFALKYTNLCNSLTMACAVSTHLVKHVAGEWFFANIPAVAKLVTKTSRKKQGESLKNGEKAYHYFDQVFNKEELEKIENNPAIAKDINDLIARDFAGPDITEGLRNDVINNRKAKRSGIIPAANTLQVPALVLHGSPDNLVGEEHGRYHASVIPNAKLIIYPGASHMIMLTFKEETMSNYLEFLASCN